VNASPIAGKTDIPVNILVVDDRPENHIALRAILSMPGYRIVSAISGPEALRRLLDEDFAVLLIDVIMPGMSGLELASAVRQRERTATVPIVFLTAQSTDANLAYDGYQAGGVDYLVRPKPSRRSYGPLGPTGSSTTSTSGGSSTPASLHRKRAAPGRAPYTRKTSRDVAKNGGTRCGWGGCFRSNVACAERRTARSAGTSAAPCRSGARRERFSRGWARSRTSRIRGVPTQL